MEEKAVVKVELVSVKGVKAVAEVAKAVVKVAKAVAEGVKVVVKVAKAVVEGVRYSNVFVLHIADLTIDDLGSLRVVVGEV